MDFLKKGQDMLKNAGGSNTTNTNNQAAPAAGGAAPAAGNAGTQDYGDKAFSFAAKKSGHNFDAGTSEKITDGVRGAYEKATGSKVDPKYSN